MGGRFGKYGDAKRKARLRKSRLRPPDVRERRRNKALKEDRTRKKRPVPILDTTIPVC